MTCLVKHYNICNCTCTGETYMSLHTIGIVIPYVILQIKYVTIMFMVIRYDMVCVTICTTCTQTIHILITHTVFT